MPTRSAITRLACVVRSRFNRSASRAAFACCLLLIFSALSHAQTSAPAAGAQAPEAPAPRSLLSSQPAASNNAGNPPPSSVSAPAGYVLSPNDQISVEVFGEDDLRTSARLNAEGNVSVPLLGSIHLAGMTLTQASSRLTEMYGRDYLVNPRVNVTLLGYARRRFTVLGQVNRPGSYDLPEGAQGGIDILEAVAMAGGYTRIAAPERVSVRRKKPNGEDEVIRVDAKRITRGRSGSFTVLAGDTVTVGESIF